MSYGNFSTATTTKNLIKKNIDLENLTSFLIKFLKIFDQISKHC